jgi:hypothetical protein
MKARQVIFPLVIGGIAKLADSWLFSNFWVALDWQRPVAEWFAGLGFPTLAGWIGLFWIRIPTFAVAAVLGFVVARLFVERWLSAMLFSALGFVGTSFLLMAWFVESMPSSASGWGIALIAETWSAVSILLVLLGAWLYARRHAHTIGAHR